MDPVDLCAVCISQLINSTSHGENAPTYTIIPRFDPHNYRGGESFVATQTDQVIRAMIEGSKFMVDGDVYTGRAATSVFGTRVCPQHTAEFMTLIMTKPGRII